MAKLSVQSAILLIEMLGALTVTVLVLIQSLYVVAVPTVDLTGPLMLVDDWETVPYTDVVAVTDGNDCPSNYFPLFNLTWPGTVEGCQVDTTEILTVPQFEAKYGGSTNKPECVNIPANEAVDQIRTLPNNAMLCGKQAGDTYLNATLLQSDGSCPDGTMPCS